MVAVGIDLGTTNSVVALARDGRIEVVPDDEGRKLHPSVVAFKPNGERAIGMPARLRRVIDPRNTIFSAKRLIGQAFESKAIQSLIAQLPYEVRAAKDGEPAVLARGKTVPVAEISTMILAHLRARAEAYAGEPVTEAVITVPANFTDGQREATRRAGEAAGLRVLRVLNEPTAAALAYGIGKQVHQRVVVFDMGGGTFDVTLLAVRDDFFEVLATGGDPFLGGDDMDKLIADRMARRFLEQHRIDLNTDPRATAILRIAGEQIKGKLSSEDEVTGSLSEIAHGEGGVPLALDFRVTRAELEQMIEPLVDRAIVKCEDVLAAAGVMAQHVDEVILVGGATRVPLVRRRVAEHFQREPRTDINPMEVVAEGAALQAMILTAPAEQSKPAPILIDVTPHALGLATAGGYTDVLIDRNQAIPAERTRVFATARDQQTEVVIRICQGGERTFANNVALGELRLDGIAAAPRGQVRIEVTFLVDADGILQVSAKDVATGHANRVSLRVLGGERA
ncbi:MAG TPA: Hsp70 family protein [Kofleriaceae bacterium]|nr:Hsp70 family protein [Kofleriaceae bacterium]